jgi:branched-chain amino acid aminotransferase
MKVNITKQSQLENIDFNNLDFGRMFTDHMLICDFDGEKWGDYSIEPLAPISMHPATSVLHYGQAIFEGLKGYRCGNDKINIFRLRDNLERMNISAERMQMPQFEVNGAFEAIEEFVRVERKWVPTAEQGSLYIRPFMIATDHTLKALSSRAFRFMVIACPVGFYYNTPLNIYVEKKHRRAAAGGVGYAKAAGNYAASFYPTEKAKVAGFDQVLWTDITNNFSLEELGSANFFYVKNNEIYTPALHDSILKGITRNTLIQIARAKGINVNEVKISADQFVLDLEAGLVQCMFATGTAAAVTYVNGVTIDEVKYEVSSDDFEMINQLTDDLNGHKLLKVEDKQGWNAVV